MIDLDYELLARQLLPAVHAAGMAEMEIYQQDFKAETKKDNSLVTLADQRAEVTILEKLVEIAPDIPVVAEEAANEGKIPDIGEQFFLVDPLDGTKEYIRKNNEFTVNIGLIEEGRPVFGIAYATAIGRLFVTLGSRQSRGRLYVFPRHGARF